VFRRVLRTSSFAALVVTAALLGGAASASATQLVTNGDFETGTLEGWTASQPSETGQWTVCNREGSAGLQLYPPPSGAVAACALVQPSTGLVYLYQDVALPAAGTDQMSMYLYYISEQVGQQIRVDVLKPEAPVETAAASDILATVYASGAGDPLTREPALINADLSSFAGQTVRLRIAVGSPSGALRVGVDGVSIESTPVPVPQPQPQPSPAPPLPSNAFSTGKLVLDRKHGGAALNVTLPGAGLLYVTDARRQIAIASARSAAKERPVLVRTASAETTGPQTVRVFLRPTAAAKKLLAKNGKVRFRLQLTFTPEGGLAATEGYSGTLLKKLRPARR
jgi:hypothetical protein